MAAKSISNSGAVVVRSEYTPLNPAGSNRAYQNWRFSVAQSRRSDLFWGIISGLATIGVGIAFGVEAAFENGGAAIGLGVVALLLLVITGGFFLQRYGKKATLERMARCIEQIEGADRGQLEKLYQSVHEKYLEALKGHDKDLQKGLEHLLAIIRQKLDV